MNFAVAVLIAATLPVLPVSKAKTLVAVASGHKAKPVVLHFWATWCGACREEFPSLRPQLTGLPAQGVGVLLVSIDRPDDRKKALQMLADFRLQRSHAVLLDAPRPDPVAKALGEPKWDGTLPATFVFDAQRKLRKSFIGRANPKELRAAVREARH